MLEYQSFSRYIYLMTITQTVDIPADRRIMLEVPREIPTGTTARFELIWFPEKNEAKPSAKADVSIPGDKEERIVISREKLDEMKKNSQTLHKLTGILSELRDADLDSIRYKEFGLEGF